MLFLIRFELKYGIKTYFLGLNETLVIRLLKVLFHFELYLLQKIIEEYLSSPIMILKNCFFTIHIIAIGHM